ncbi:hypothetical protein EJB05_56417, partial [Eragrostis curvula]
MGKLRRHAAHCVSILRSDDGVGAGEARAHLDHRRQGVVVIRPSIPVVGWFQAKEVQRKVDQMVQLGKEGTLDVAKRALVLFGVMIDRAGGYTRLLRTRMHFGDAAPIAYIEFVDRDNRLREAKPGTPQPPE